MVFNVGEIPAPSFNLLFQTLPLRHQFVGHDFHHIGRILDIRRGELGIATGRSMRIGNRDDQNQDQSTNGTQQNRQEWKQSGCVVIATSPAPTHPACLFQVLAAAIGIVVGSVEFSELSKLSISGASAELGTSERRRTGCLPKNPWRSN